MATGNLGKIEYNLLNKYQKINFFFVGKHPRTRVIHHQWLMDSMLLKTAKLWLSPLPQSSRILDVGCGNGPYWSLNTQLNLEGLDIVNTPKTNYVISENGLFPIEDSQYDFLLCTQVLEHVVEPTITLNEILRVLRPGGVCFMNMPFLYPFHGMPDDRRRYTTTQLKEICKEFEIFEVGTIGGIGSSLGTLWLNFLEYQINATLVGKLIRIVLTPVFYLQSLIVNCIGKLVDTLDKTESFPTNTYIVMKKPLTQT